MKNRTEWMFKTNCGKLAASSLEFQNDSNRTVDLTAQLPFFMVDTILNGQDLVLFNNLNYSAQYYQD